MEKVINEFKVIETDDGFRIEIKGDKEMIRHMLRGFGSPFRKHHHGFGPHFWAGFGDWCGGWPWADEKEEEEEKESH